MESDDEHIDEVDLKQESLPLKTMIVVCIVMFSEPLSMTLLYPFIYFMVRDFEMVDDNQTGYYVGFITASFSIAQFTTNLAWGLLSDRYGR